jgi:CheY-like chemotaxis protein
MSSHLPVPGSLNILVVDDEEAVRQVLEALLVLMGHRVGLATDGLAAFGRFQSDPWDVVLTDRQMPLMDGEELARRLKALSPRTPVIMVTAVPPLEGCAHVDVIVPKPFSLGTIVEAISRCVAPPPGGGIAAAAA